MTDECQFSPHGDPDTNWEALLALQDPARQREAMGVLLELYKKVIWRRMVRSMGERDAEDAFQDFAKWVIEGNRFAGATPASGKFRTLLATMLSNWLHNRHRAAVAEKRGGGVVHEELSGDERGADGLEDALFDRDWALELLRRAVRRTAKDGDDSAEEVMLSALGSRSEKALRKLIKAIRSELVAVCREPFIESELEYLIKVLSSALLDGPQGEAGKDGG